MLRLREASGSHVGLACTNLYGGIADMLLEEAVTVSGYCWKITRIV
jgi:hypothetical protein